MNFFSSGKSKTPEKTSVNEKQPTQEPLLVTPKNCKAITKANLDEEQQQKLAQLREDISKIMLSETDDYYENEKRFLTDATLHRYLRARKWDLNAARTMLENTMKWRREFRPDQLDPDYIRPEVETGKMYYNGYDFYGRPSLIMRPRNENSKDGDRQIKHIVFCLERGIRLMPEGVETVNIIIDFKGAMASQHPSIATSKKFLEILGNHYPERLGTAFVVKSPWFFLTTFKIISPFIDPVTKSKIKFVYDKKNENDSKNQGSEMAYLPDYFPEEQIETEFNGKYHFEFSIDTYWTQLLELTGNPYKIIDY
ncbi:unnamed protein product [Cunninghamella echinulata]